MNFTSFVLKERVEFVVKEIIRYYLRFLSIYLMYNIIYFKLRFGLVNSIDFNCFKLMLCVVGVIFSLKYVIIEFAIPNLN